MKGYTITDVGKVRSENQDCVRFIQNAIPFPMPFSRSATEWEEQKQAVLQVKLPCLPLQRR